jgi:hypothetical protein
MRLDGESDHHDAKGASFFFGFDIRKDPYGFCCVEGDATWGDGTATDDASALLLPCEPVCGDAMSDFTAGRTKASKPALPLELRSIVRDIMV